MKSRNEAIERMKAFAAIEKDMENRACAGVNVKPQEMTHEPKEYGNWKSSRFIRVLEEVQAGIRNGELTSLDQCIDNTDFLECSMWDQEQLVDIANWYLYNEDYI